MRTVDGSQHEVDDDGDWLVAAAQSVGEQAPWWFAAAVLALLLLVALAWDGARRVAPRLRATSRLPPMAWLVVSLAAGFAAIAACAAVFAEMAEALDAGDARRRHRHDGSADQRVLAARNVTAQRLDGHEGLA